MKVSKKKRDIQTREKKKRNSEENLDTEAHVTLNNEVDHGMQLIKIKKGKVSMNRKRKNKDKILVARQSPKDKEADLEEQTDGEVDNCHSKAEIKDSNGNGDSNMEPTIEPCRSKDAKKKRKKEIQHSPKKKKPRRSKESKMKREKEIQNSPEKRESDHQDEIHTISSGDDDCSNGMKKWIKEYHQSRPGLEVLQQRIDDFVTAYEEKQEEERKAKEALAADGGWTVVVHHKGRKKTTDSESGIAVGSVAQVAVENKLAKKKHKEVGLDFYRFQKREAQRNEIMQLQDKFAEDKKRLQQLRAARKFRPY